METPPNILYEEHVTSRRTTTLFVILTLLFATLLSWRTLTSDLGCLTIVFLVFFVFFLFYSLNYRVLTIHLTSGSLVLRFGIFSRRIPTSNIQRCHLDDVSMWRVGGAGIHFTSISRRYREYFNFIEYPRVVVALRETKGPVRDVVFSSTQPNEVMRLIGEVVSSS